MDYWSIEYIKNKIAVEIIFNNLEFKNIVIP